MNDCLPPFSKATYGNLQTLPNPTAKPREERKNSKWLPQDSLSSVIVSLAWYLQLSIDKNHFKNKDDDIHE